MPDVAHLAVREMTEGDISAVEEIERSSFPEPASGGPSDLLPTRTSRLREELSRPWSHSWVVGGDDAVALAFLIAWHVADEVQLLNVAVHPEHRRRGLGTMLLRHAIDFARAKNARHLLLEVRRSNEGAIRAYRSVGFFAVAVRHRYYPDDEDAVAMDLVLDPETGEVMARVDEVRLDVRA